ncbi:MAG: YitT family protein [Dorea sp.]|nr:YitT family protein [Dorea sp.]
MKMKIGQEQIAKIGKEYGILTLATIGTIVENYLFKFPNHFTFGGVTGIAVLLSGVFGGTPNTYAFVINILLFGLGFLVLGKGFGIKSIYVTLLFSVGLEAVQYIYPVTEPVTTQPVLDWIFAFVITAVSSAVIFNLGASSGGTDIIALILKKYTKIKIGKALMIVDFVVVVSSFFIYGATVGCFSLAGYLAKAFFVDSVIESLNSYKYFTIISEDSAEICEFIQDKLNHSATIYTAEGAYAHKKKVVIMTVVNRNQAMRLRNFVRATQPDAFMMITNSSEIIGNGFQRFE